MSVVWSVKVYTTIKIAPTALANNKDRISIELPSVKVEEVS
jgi:hypothetical protein